MTLLRTDALAHSFDYPLFHDVSFELQAGETMAIIGVSGSGKSTLLHILASLLKPEKGSVELFGKLLYALQGKELVHLRRHELGLIFQSHYLFKGFSAYENLEIASLLSQEDIEPELLERLDIAEVIQQKVTELSGGQQQRVSIARILTKKPKMIFADEPTGNLDQNTATEVMQLFQEYVQEHQAGLVMVTHAEALAMQCDKVFRLHEKHCERIQ